MNNLNSVLIEGNVVRKPDYRTTEKGAPLCAFTCRPLFFPFPGDILISVWRKAMELKYTYWKEENFYIGYLDDYPERKTQGENIQDLENALKEIYGWIMDGTLPVKERKGILRIA
jgi:hypothetical protein